MDAVIVRTKCPSDILTLRRFRRALTLLREANWYAEQTSSDPWEFAVGIQELRRHGLSENDFRFLMRLKYLQHASEVTAAGTDGRQFRRTGDLSFSEQSCFVLTEKGVVAASNNSSERSYSRRHDLAVISISRPARSHRKLSVPNWNLEHRTLTFDGKIVRQFKRHAVNQELILTAFQEESWPTRIDDPLAPQPCQDMKRRLHDTIKCLNRGRERSLLRFRGDGTGEGVVWETAL